MAIDLEKLRRRLEQEQDGHEGPAASEPVRPPVASLNVRHPEETHEVPKSQGPFLVLFIVACVVLLTWWYHSTREKSQQEAPINNRAGENSSPAVQSRPPSAQQRQVPPTYLQPTQPNPEADASRLTDSVLGVVTRHSEMADASIEGTLRFALQSTDRESILASAREMARISESDRQSVTRNRPTARKLHDGVKNDLNVWPQRNTAVCSVLARAFLEDSLR